jgi:hypothetical protein
VVSPPVGFALGQSAWSTPAYGVGYGSVRVPSVYRLLLGILNGCDHMISHTKERKHTYNEMTCQMLETAVVAIFFSTPPIPNYRSFDFFDPKFDHSSYSKNLCKHS